MMTEYNTQDRGLQQENTFDSRGGWEVKKGVLSNYDDSLDPPPNTQDSSGQIKVYRDSLAKNLIFLVVTAILDGGGYIHGELT